MTEPTRSLAYDSATSYQFCHDAGGEGDYVTWADTAMSRWDAFEETYGVYYPHVSIGWDNTQRNPSIQHRRRWSHARCLRSLPLEGQALPRRAPGPDAVGDDQQLERVDRGQLPVAGHALGLSLSAGRSQCVWGAKMNHFLIQARYHGRSDNASVGSL